MQSSIHLHVSYIMAILVEDVALEVLDDYGFLECDSDNKRDDIYIYLGPPVLYHKDLTTDQHDEAIEEDGGKDYDIDDEATDRSKGSTSDSNSGNSFKNSNRWFT